MIVRIIGEDDKEISEDLYDKQSELMLCSLYCIRRPLTKLHLFFNKERFLILSVIANEDSLKEIHFSDKIKYSIYNSLSVKKDKGIRCDFLSKWKILDNNSLCYAITPKEEAELAKLLVNKQII